MPYCYVAKIAYFRFYKISLSAGIKNEHIRFVFDCLKKNTTEIRNIRQYLLTALYNAPVSINSHYAAQVNHDLYG